MTEATTKPRRPIEREERREMVRLYLKEKLTIRQVSVQMGRSYFSVWQTLERFKIPRHPRTSPTPPRQEPLVLSEAERAEIVQLYTTGSSLRDIATYKRRSIRVVRLALVDAGVEIRPPRFQPR